MVPEAALLAVSALLAPVGEKSLFHIPSTDEFRQQLIQRTDREQGWPFSVDEGYLSCVYVMGQRTVYFAEVPSDDEDEVETAGRAVVVSTDPLDLAFVNIGANDLFAPFSGLADLIPMLAPFERLGQRLCDQPQGATMGPGEL